MTPSHVVVRCLARPDTLERVGGLLRRRGFAVERVSCAFVGDDTIEFVIRIDDAATPVERVHRELLSLRDVTSVASGGPPPTTRELLVARLPAHPGHESDNTDGIVVEMIGSPTEIDAMVEWLRRHTAEASYVRSGEVATPHDHPVNRDETQP